MFYKKIFLSLLISANIASLTSATNDQDKKQFFTMEKLHELIKQ